MRVFRARLQEGAADIADADVDDVLAGAEVAGARRGAGAGAGSICCWVPVSMAEALPATDVTRAAASVRRLSLREAGRVLLDLRDDWEFMAVDAPSSTPSAASPVERCAAV